MARAVDAPPAPKLMLRLLQCALCGRSIALFSRSATLLTVTAEALRALLAPFEWQCAYEPVVPSKRYLDALAARAADEPFIVGVLANMPLEGVSSSFVGPPASHRVSSVAATPGVFTNPPILFNARSAPCTAFPSAVDASFAS